MGEQINGNVTALSKNLGEQRLMEMLLSQTKWEQTDGNATVSSKIGENKDLKNVIAFIKNWREHRLIKMLLSKQKSGEQRLLKCHCLKLASVAEGIMNNSHKPRLKPTGVCLWGNFFQWYIILLRNIWLTTECIIAQRKIV